LPHIPSSFAEAVAKRQAEEKAETARQGVCVFMYFH
jgi:hypothetical protein